MDKKQFLRRIFDRLKDREGLATDVGLVDVLHTQRTTLESWRARGPVPWDALVEYAQARGVSLDWLLLGRESAAPGTAESAGAYLADGPAELERALAEAFEIIDSDAHLHALFGAAPPARRASALSGLVQIVQSGNAKRLPAGALAAITRLGQAE